MQAIKGGTKLNADFEDVGTGFAEAGSDPKRFFAQVSTRCSGAGGFYNIGNLIALLAGLTVQSTGGADHQNATDMIYDYLIGSPAASSLTLSMIVFIAAGEAYHRASNALAVDERRLNRIGDLLAGIAAIIVTVALVSFGDAQLALTAGIMLAVGKIGTAIIPEGTGRPAISRSFRLLVIASRFPSLVALAITIVRFFDGRENQAEAMVAATMFICYALWLWADCLLLSKARS